MVAPARACPGPGALNRLKARQLGLSAGSGGRGLRRPALVVSSGFEFGLAGPRNGRYAPHPFREFRVTSTAGFNSVALSGRSRFLAATVGGGLLALLVVASQLQPDPRGLGTHQQLGLPPCTFSMLFGQRCPACGMTTSWSLVTHGRLSEALNNHISGTVLAGLALTGGLTAAGLAGHDLVGLAQAVVPQAQFNQAAGGSVGVGVGETQIINTSGVPQQVKSMSTQAGYSFVVPPSSPQCQVGTTVAPSGICYVDISSPVE